VRRSSAGVRRSSVGVRRKVAQLVAVDSHPYQGDKPDPDQIKIRIQIRIKVISYSRIRNSVSQYIKFRFSKKCIEKFIKLPLGPDPGPHIK
jgi:hypothetical protein